MIISIGRAEDMWRVIYRDLLGVRNEKWFVTGWLFVFRKRKFCEQPLKFSVILLKFHGKVIGYGLLTIIG